MKTNKNAAVIRCRLNAIQDSLNAFNLIGCPLHFLDVLGLEIEKLEKELNTCKILTYTNQGIKRKENYKILREFKKTFEEIKTNIINLQNLHL